MYDAFISYSRQDEAWAVKLEAALKARGLNPYRDTNRLLAGDEWDTQLVSAITEESRHLIVLWSDYAEKSQWVTMEMAYFETSGRGDAGNLRRRIHNNLQGQSRVFQKYEAIDDLEEAGVYGLGVKSLDQNPAAWRSVLDKVEESIRQDNAVPIYKAILTSTLDRLQAVPLDRKSTSFAPTYGETLERIGIKREGGPTWQSELAKYYGAARSDWKPFGGARSIDVILSELRDKLLLEGAPTFRWKAVSDDFWTNDRDKMDREVARLRGEFCVVVVDPVSLYDDDVRSTLDALRDYLNDRSGVLILAPFSIPREAAHFRNLIRGSANFLYNNFFEMGPSGGIKPHIGLCEDDLDIRRLINSILRRPREDNARIVQPAPLRT